MKAHHGLQFEGFSAIDLHSKKCNAYPHIITAVFRKSEEPRGIQQVRFDAGLNLLECVRNFFEAMDLHASGFVLFGPIGTGEVAENRFHLRS